jgi:hypothetical protein
MTSEVGKVVQQAGLVDGGTVSELRKWGAPLSRVDSGPPVPAEIVPTLIERAMQAQDFVQVRETDLEVLQVYLQTQQRGELKIEALDGQIAVASVSFGMMPTGEVIVPWVEESISEALEDCLVSVGTANGFVNLRNPRELYYGDRKMFVLWSVGT